MTQDDISSIEWFWRDKGDLERWMGWESFAQNAKDARSLAVVKAWRDYVAARAVLDAVVDSL